MIIWKGLGIVVILIVVVCQVAAGMLATSMTGNPDYYELHGWVMGAGCLAAAVACWFVGKAMNGPGRELVDPRTGQRVVLRRSHSLFFVPVQWWAVPLVAFACAIAFHNTTPEQLRQERADRAAQREARQQAREMQRAQNQNH